MSIDDFETPSPSFQLLCGTCEDSQMKPTPPCSHSPVVKSMILFEYLKAASKAESHLSPTSTIDGSTTSNDAPRH